MKVTAIDAIVVAPTQEAVIVTVMDLQIVFLLPMCNNRGQNLTALNTVQLHVMN